MSIMSYCVNCGVELESSLQRCPLCNTPVLNPKELERISSAFTPYPKESGQVDMVKRKDLAILTSVVLIATSLCCLLLNLLVFTGSPWSLFIIGACLLLFVILFPVVIYSKLPVYVSLLLDGAAVAFYLYMITFNTADSRWFTELALPIVVLVTILVEIFAILLHALKVSFLSTALYFFIEAALLCVSLELLIDRFSGAVLRLTWSAIILTICCVITASLITILAKHRLREAVRRRLHF
jgi:hypothetical protein